MILLDTDVLIDYLKGIEPTYGRIRKMVAEGATLGTTSLSVTELLRGAYGKGSRNDLKSAEDVLGGLREIPFGPKAARRCARLLASLDREGNAPSLADAVIASIALEEGAPLLTRNDRDFGRFEGLAVLAPTATE